MTRRIALLLFALFICAELFARVGGGQSYSGGGSSSSSGGGGGSSSSSRSSSSSSSSSSYSGGGGGGGPSEPIPAGCVIAYLVGAFLLIGGVAIYRMTAKPSTVFQFETHAAAAHRPLDQLRRSDPNFSRIVFEDFCYALYARVHQARGAGDLTRYAPYLSEPVRRGMAQHNPKGLTEVRGMVIGGMEVGELVIQSNTPLVSVDVMYDANMTEVIDGGETSWYVREQWTFERQRDILSPPPEKAKAEHCPRCGAALQTRSDGSCEFCGAKIESGAFQWYVRSVAVESKEARGPLLTSNVEEQGTGLPTLFHPQFLRRAREFEAAHPGFDWDALVKRVEEIARKLQDAWSARDWERVRPLETDPLFQMHRYWIDAYRRQSLRNVVDDFTVKNVETVKVDSDPFYDAITFRVHASGRDYTTDEVGNLVAGSRHAVRVWTEYWTLIRTRGTQVDPSATVSCPNCGASVVVGATGVCRFCNGKLTGGQFGWVLSRIEQDEAYTG